MAHRGRIVRTASPVGTVVAIGGLSRIDAQAPAQILRFCPNPQAGLIAERACETRSINSRIRH